MRASAHCCNVSSEVLALSEEGDNFATPKIDAKGNFTTVRVGSKVPLPENTETLRQRLELWGRSWLFAAFMHTNSPLLAKTGYRGLHSLH